MAYRRGNGNVRQLGQKAPLSMVAGGEYALKCLGLAAAYALGEGVPVYFKTNRDKRQALMRFYLPDDTAEGWVDLGPDVREEVAALLEEAFTAELANRVYDACGDRPAERPQEAPNAHYRGPKPRKGVSVDPGASEGA